jgi:hypothetical protein
VLRPHTRNPGFFGRKDVLDQIEGALVPSANSTTTAGQPVLRSFAVCGLGGLGKTQTAVEFAFAHQQDFDAIFWVQAEDRDKLAASFSQIASELSIIDPADIGNHVVGRDLDLECRRRFHSHHQSRSARKITLPIKLGPRPEDFQFARRNDSHSETRRSRLLKTRTRACCRLSQKTGWSPARNHTSSSISTA